MATQETMDIRERFKYLRLVRERYRTADRKARSRLLDEMEAMTGHCRKYLITRMNSPGPYRRPRRRERSRTYGPDVERAVLLIADTLDWICAERLKPALPKMACHLEVRRDGDNAPPAERAREDQRVHRQAYPQEVSPAEGSAAPVPSRAPSRHRGTGRGPGCGDPLEAT